METQDFKIIYCFHEKKCNDTYIEIKRLNYQKENFEHNIDKSKIYYWFHYNDGQLNKLNFIKSGKTYDNFDYRILQNEIGNNIFFLFYDDKVLISNSKFDYYYLSSDNIPTNILKSINLFIQED